ncbi:MAG: DUF1003 domain-containing protein, partial [Candidatus Ancillula sp.]|nr:DUF1003 domain-containing protein [Candidatus Ancillula sp.]
MSKKAEEKAQNRLLQSPIRRRRRDFFNPFSAAYNPHVTATRSKSDLGGKVAEAIARFCGTPAFLFWLSVFCIVWIAWNTLAPEAWRFDSASLGFTALTLMLSLQASYSAPLILLAQ